MNDFLLAGLASINVLGQTAEWGDLAVVGVLILLEGVLSIDNALVLGLLAKRLPPHQRAKALSYGLIGAFVFRVIAILVAGFLLHWNIAKLLGGGYLIWIAVKHLFLSRAEGEPDRIVVPESGQPELVDAATGAQLGSARQDAEIQQRIPGFSGLLLEASDSAPEPAQTDKESRSRTASPGEQSRFWKTVIVIELTDIAFAVDSILAAMALAGSRRSKLWVVITGGIIGVILMRFAAAAFIRLLDRFPRFELAAYLLVILIGGKLVLDWGFNSDWSLRQNPVLANAVGNWREGFEDLEESRRAAANGYRDWLEKNWLLGSSVEHTDAEHQAPDALTPPMVPHLLDFHDLRRPECLAFWCLMAAGFGVGFLKPRGPPT